MKMRKLAPDQAAALLLAQMGPSMTLGFALGASIDAALVKGLTLEQYLDEVRAAFGERTRARASGQGGLWSLFPAPKARA